MTSSTRLWPTLGITTAVLCVVAPYLVLRFAPAPVEVAMVVTALLLVALGVFGYLGTARGHAATFVAIALVLPTPMLASVVYGSAERATSEIGSFLEEDELFDESFEDSFDDSSEGDGTYGSDPELDALQDECLAGDADACDDLFYQSPSGSEYEQTALDEGAGS